MGYIAPVQNHSYNQYQIRNIEKMNPAKLHLQKVNRVNFKGINPSISRDHFPKDMIVKGRYVNERI